MELSKPDLKNTPCMTTQFSKTHGTEGLKNTETSFDNYKS